MIDGIHSFSDLITDFFVLLISRLAHDEPDLEHPYGHDRIETIGTFALGSLIMFSAGALAYENVERLIENKELLKPGWPTMVIAFVSIISKEWIFRYTKKAGERLRSPIVVANAWHSRSDAYSSLVVLVGIIFSFFGYVWLDTVAAFIVALMIGKVGWDFVKNSLSELADTGVDKEKLRSYRDTIESIYGVQGAHNLRSRRMGYKVILDVNVEVDDILTVSEGHEISSWVAKELIEKFDEVSDVVVHTDIENDMVSQFHSNNLDLLPLRDKVMAELETYWGREVLSKVKHLRLHYHNQKILVELYLPMSARSLSPFNQTDFEDILNNKAKEINWYKSVVIYYSSK
jgi:cation diffusion facilitator family transporter